MTDLDFTPTEQEKTVERIHYTREGKPQEIVLTEDDYVFVTLGSMTSAPHLESKQAGGSWTRWETLTKKRPTLADQPFSMTIEMNQHGNRLP